MFKAVGNKSKNRSASHVGDDVGSFYVFPMMCKYGQSHYIFVVVKCHFHQSQSKTLSTKSKQFSKTKPQLDLNLNLIHL